MEYLWLFPIVIITLFLIGLVYLDKRRRIIEVVKVLRKLEYYGSRQQTGVCNIVLDATGGMVLGRVVPFEKYPNFSGNLDFPVPDPNGCNPCHAYMYCEDYWGGAYGKERIRFAKWCADYLCEKWNIKENP